MKRQIGNLQCNIDRLSTVTNLAKTTTAVQNLASAGARSDLPHFKLLHLTEVLTRPFCSFSDPAVSAAASSAMTGLQSAQQGIQTIATALLSGQTAPADARTQVGDGLTAAGSALGNVTS